MGFGGRGLGLCGFGSSLGFQRFKAIGRVYGYGASELLRSSEAL